MEQFVETNLFKNIKRSIANNLILLHSSIVLKYFIRKYSREKKTKLIIKKNELSIKIQYKKLN